MKRPRYNRKANRQTAQFAAVILVIVVVIQFAFIGWELTRSAMQPTLVLSPSRQVHSQALYGNQPSFADAELFDDSDYGVLSGWKTDPRTSRIDNVAAANAGFYPEGAATKQIIRDVAVEPHLLQQESTSGFKDAEHKLLAANQVPIIDQPWPNGASEGHAGEVLRRGDVIASSRAVMGLGNLSRANDIITELAGSSIAFISVSSAMPWIELKNGHKLFVGATLNQDYRVRDIQKDSVMLDGPFGSLIISVKGQIIQ